VKSPTGTSIPFTLLGLVAGSITGYFDASLLASLHFVNNGDDHNGWRYFLTFGRNEPPSLAANAPETRCTAKRFLGGHELH